MQLNASDISGVVEILNRLYTEIREIELNHTLLFGNGDFRPRIDYFHDAVRAFTEQHPRHTSDKGRLTIELLAYDVASLRYIASMPLARLHANSRPRSPSTALDGKDRGVSSPAGSPDRNTKLKLAELYQQYGVLFSALFKPYADDDYEERTGSMNDEVEQIATIMQRLEAGASEEELVDLIHHLHSPSLRDGLIELMRKKKKRELMALLDESSDQNDSLIQSLEDAHLQYATAQLGLYEEGRDIVKNLAAKGMNLAGQFVENAMAATRRDMGRGGRGGRS